MTDRDKLARDTYETDETDETDDLYDADPDCAHVVWAEWSGMKCAKCQGWFCY